MSLEKIITNIESLAQNMNLLNEQQLIEQALNISSEEYTQFKQLKGKGQKKICSAKLPKNSLYFECFDCSSDNLHVYCPTCLQLDKHKKHVVTYHYSMSEGGCCDCGDENIMKQESFCFAHTNKNIVKQEIELKETLIKKYRNFIQIAFSLLYRKIEEVILYPYDFQKKLNVAQQYLNDSILDKYLYNQSNQLKMLKEKANQVLIFTQLIRTIFNQLIVDNIAISKLTSKLLQQSIDKEIQASIQLYHNHENKPYYQTNISQNPSLCNCNILELYVRFNGFLTNIVPPNSIDLSELFCQLHADEQFKSNLCKYSIQYFHELYIPIEIKRFVMINGMSFQISFNQLSYSDKDNSLREILTILNKSQKISAISNISQMVAGKIFEYFYQFQGHIVTELIRQLKLNQNNQPLQFFEIFSKKILQLQLQDEQTLKLSFRFQQLILQQFSLEMISICFDQIFILMGSKNEFFNNSLMSPDQTFIQLQNNSILIYAFTRIYPLSTANNFNYYYENQEHEIDIIQFLRLQSQILTCQRSFLNKIIEAWKIKYPKNETGLKNILRVFINYFLKNFIKNDINIQSQSVLIRVLRNYNFCDRNLIVLLSIYLKDYLCSKDAYQDLLILSGQSQVQFRYIMQLLLKRTLLNFNIFSIHRMKDYYRGFYKLFTPQSNNAEVSLEQVDMTFIQMYAFIFFDDGINDIIDQNELFKNVLNKMIDVNQIICRIAQSDYDYIQCLGFLNQDGQTKRGLNKLFQTIFYAQSFYSSSDLRKLLEQFSHDSTFQAEQMILSTCELNPDNQLLQLKKEFTPPQYEPIYALQIPSLKEKIEDKLKSYNNKFEELFGSSLIIDLSNLNNSTVVTISKKRLILLEAIGNDQKQKKLNNLIIQLNNLYKSNDLQSSKDCITLLENSALYINLLFQINKFIKNNKVIDSGLNKMKILCQQLISNSQFSNNQILKQFLILLDEQNRNSSQQFQSDTSNELKIKQKKQILKEKYQKMGQKYEKEKEFTEIQSALSVCSICHLYLNYQEVICQIVLFQLANYHQYHPQIEQQKEKYFNLQAVFATCCGHQFHYQCINQNKSFYQLGESTYFKCPTCSQPYNFLFINPESMNYLENEQLKQNIELFFSTLSEQEIKEYLKNYSLNFDINHNQFIYNLFSSLLYNLLQQLLQDINIFYQKKNHIFLQEVLKYLHIVCTRNLEEPINYIQYDDSHLIYKLLNLIQDYMIIQDWQVNKFEVALQQVKPQFQNLKEIFQILTRNILPNVNNQLKQLNDNYQLNTKIKETLLKFFQPNYREFIIKNYLTKCHKKECMFLPHLRINEVEQMQYICLICLKKICSPSCIQEENMKKGNLCCHTIEQHLNKSIYLQIRSTQIIIQITPFILKLNCTLYQDNIGQQPELGNFQSNYYEKYKLNLKAIDIIVDIITEEKYISKMIGKQQDLQDINI